MAQKEVTHSGKADDGDITRLCGQGFKDEKAVAIANIDADPSAYFVDDRGKRAYVRVKRHQNGTRYLTTAPDGSLRNNLSELRDC